MIRIIRGAALACAMGTPALAADPVFGTYKTQPGDTGRFAHVELYDCDGNICGVIRKAFDETGSEIASAGPSSKRAKVYSLAGAARPNPGVAKATRRGEP